MENSLSKYLLIDILVVFLIIFSNVAFAKDKEKLLDENLAGLFIKELLKNESVEIKNNPDECISKARPVTLFREFSDILIQALHESENIKIKATCKVAKDVKPFYFCNLYFFSSQKDYEWSAGFTFLGNPKTGEINFDSLGCFST